MPLQLHANALCEVRASEYAGEGAFISCEGPFLDLSVFMDSFMPLA